MKFDNLIENFWKVNEMQDISNKKDISIDKTKEKKEETKKPNILDTIKWKFKKKETNEENTIKKENPKEKKQFDIMWLFNKEKKEPQQKNNSKEENKQTTSNITSSFIKTRKNLLNWNLLNKDNKKNIYLIIWWFIALIIISVFWYQIYNKYNTVNSWTQEVSTIQKTITKNNEKTNKTNKIATTNNTKQTTTNTTNIKKIFSSYWIKYRINKRDWKIKIIT